MLPFLVFGALAAFIRSRQQAPAINVPQYRGGGVDQNAVAAPQPIAPLALSDQIVPGRSPAAMAGGLPTSLGAIPPLSALTEFEFVEAIPDQSHTDPVESIQIDPSADGLTYGMIR